MIQDAVKVEIGTKLGPDLTVLEIVDARGDEPVYLVWHRQSWCPMLCKVGRSKRAAQHEADVLTALSHPNIVRCFGLSEAVYLLMEYQEGPNLGAFVKTLSKRQLGVDDALRLSIYVGAALCHVHDRGLLHLDVKPSNIVIVNGRPILCDFGIARWQTGPRPDGVVGTEAYIAPEECRLEALTPAADVFGLGVTLYELLTGHLPFPKKRKSTERYPQLSQRPQTIRQHRRSVSPRLEKLVLSCLRRDPKKRPSLAQLLPALNRFIGRGPLMWPANFHPERQTPKSMGVVRPRPNSGNTKT
jgi:eukaryotic-like serine/threonine-protein kinase